jgi:hypothetical protein
VAGRLLVVAQRLQDDQVLRCDRWQVDADEADRADPLGHALVEEDAALPLKMTST